MAPMRARAARARSGSETLILTSRSSKKLFLRDRDEPFLSVAQDAQPHRTARGHLGELALRVGGAGHRRLPDAQDDVTFADAGARRRAVRIDVHHHRAARALEPQLARDV